MPRDARRITRRLPSWPKVATSLWLVVLVPIYWRYYGPTNFLWFSDIALFLATAALWLEKRLLASIAAVATLIPEIAWNLDFFTRLLSGWSPMGLASYMWDREIPLHIRLVSLFHVPLVPLLLWLVARLGYDRRALPVQVGLALLILPLSRLLGTPQENINWTYGLGSKPQEALPPWLYFCLLMLAMPLLIYLPTHLVLNRWKGVDR